MKLLDGKVHKCPECGGELSKLGTVFQEECVEQTVGCRNDTCIFLATYKFKIVLDKVVKES